MQHIITFFRVDTSKAGIVRGVMALIITLWVLAWIIFGAATAQVGDLYNWPKTFAFGLFGLVSGGALLTLWQRQPLKNALIPIIVGGFPVCVVSVWMGASVPQYLASTNLPSERQELRLEDLITNRPELPAYVTIRGYPARELTLTETYTVRDNTTKRTETYTFSQLPLVDTEWTADDPVLVVMESDAYESLDTEQGEVIATGVLYPVTPRPGERRWVNPPVGLTTQYTAEWYRQNAQFNFDPENLYFLSKDSPGSLKFLPILFSVFTLALIVVVVRIAMGSAPENPTVDSQLEKPHKKRSVAAN
jgi:hypothetical protein